METTGEEKIIISPLPRKHEGKWSSHLLFPKAFRTSRLLPKAVNSGAKQESPGTLSNPLAKTLLQKYPATELNGKRKKASR